MLGGFIGRPSMNGGGMPGGGMPMMMRGSPITNSRSSMGSFTISRGTNSRSSMKTSAPTITPVQRWGPCYLGYEYAGLSSDYGATTNSPATPNVRLSSTGASSGGAFSHTAACAWSIFGDQPPACTGWDDLFGHQEYMDLSAQMAHTPSEEQFGEANAIIQAKFYAEELEAKGSGSALPAAIEKCWVHELGMYSSGSYTQTFNSAGGLQTANPTNCCPGSPHEEACVMQIFSPSNVDFFMCCESPNCAVTTDYRFDNMDSSMCQEIQRDEQDAKAIAQSMYDCETCGS